MKTRNFKFSLLLIIAVVFSSFSTSVFGQVPEKMSYQAVVRNASNELIVNKQIGVLISITQGIFPPISVYSETHIATTNSNGLLTLQLGGGKLVSGNFSTIKWENGNVSVSANYDLSGGTNYTILSSSQLLSVPYALYAKTAGNATGGSTCPDGTTVGEIKYWNGTSWIAVAPTLDGKFLTVESGTPIWKETNNTTSNLPQVTTSETSTDESFNLITGGNVISDAGHFVTIKGICWSTTLPPTINNNATINGSGGGTFISKIEGLNGETNYYLRAYAINDAGVGYGAIKNVKTNDIRLPNVTIDSVYNISTTIALAAGNITSTGGSDITAKGVCWSTLEQPTINDSKTVNGIGNGSFVGTMTGLSFGNNYYVRAYATNNKGTIYGEQRTFLTLPLAVTNEITSITGSSALCSSNVMSVQATILARGVCWSTTPNPTISNNKTSDGATSGIITSTISGLTINTTYYVRAYATNATGTMYGLEKVFKTSTSPSLPVVITVNATTTSSTTASIKGEISDNGGGTISVRGICYGISHNPTIEGTKTTNGGGNGLFTAEISGLTTNATYYARAYATNSTGTSYGNEVSFTTLDNIVTDIDGNIYHTVTIGTQTWMMENLNTTHYRNGDVIASENFLAWQMGGYGMFQGSPVGQSKYGKLYNWDAVIEKRNIAPVGWHIPTDEEWFILEVYVAQHLGISPNVATALAANYAWAYGAGTNPIYDATPGSVGYDLSLNNSSHFGALPAGYISDEGLASTGVYTSACWWSIGSNEDGTWVRRLSYSDKSLIRDNHWSKFGFSVRCIKD